MDKEVILNQSLKNDNRPSKINTIVSPQYSIFSPNKNISTPPSSLSSSRSSSLSSSESDKHNSSGDDKSNLSPTVLNKSNIWREVN